MASDYKRFKIPSRIPYERNTRPTTRTPSECVVPRVGLLAASPAALSLKISAAAVARKFLNF